MTQRMLRFVRVPRKRFCVWSCVVAFCTWPAFLQHAFGFCPCFCRRFKPFKVYVPRTLSLAPRALLVVIIVFTRRCPIFHHRLPSSCIPTPELRSVGPRLLPWKLRRVQTTLRQAVGRNKLLRPRRRCPWSLTAFRGGRRLVRRTWNRRHRDRSQKLHATKGWNFIRRYVFRY